MQTQNDRAAIQVALGLAAFMAPFMGSSLNLAIPFIGKDFSMSAFSLTFLVSVYLLATAVFQMPAARLADLIGRRRVYLAGLCCFGIATLLSAFAWSGTALIVFRFVSGLGSAMVFSTMIAILTVVFPKEERGRALGVNTAIVYLALSIGPFAGGVLSEYLGWRSIFYISFGLLVAAYLAASRAIRQEWVEARGEPYDYAGATVYMLAIGGVVLGFSHLPHWGGWTLFGAGVLAAAAFAVIEKRHTYPLLKLDLFLQNRHFRLSALSAMINYSASFGISFLLSLYLHFIKGLSAEWSGFVLMAQPFAQAALSPLAGRLSDRINPSYLTTSGMAAITLGLLLMSFLTPGTPIVHIVCILFMVGIGFAMFSSPNVNMIMGSVSRRDAGLASATTGTARQIGQSMSIAITSLIVHVYMGELEMSVETAAMYLPAMQVSFLLFAGICLVGVYTSASKLTGRASQTQWRHISGRFDNADDASDPD